MNNETEITGKLNTDLLKNNIHSEAIAIIGMACRFPGANNHNEFWENLEKGIDSITEIPKERWDINNFYSSNIEIPNTSVSKWGGFIENIDKFDANFFQISGTEARRMDPQQRIMLELSWSCLEEAGYSPLELSGKNVGVFIGVCNFDYKELQDKYETIEGHNSTGTYTCIIPNRISYFFNFHGPSIPIDTACSSSLVAIHQAVNALNQNECEMALVGGVNILCTPTSYISFSKLGMLSPEGKCKTFDAKADGYVRGEGAGLILLKPYRKAVEDKNYIYGVVKGSAINHGGHARTLTSPNAYSQSQVVRSAYIKANITPDTVSYIEAHGTGTPLGDPIEINGLKRAYTQLYRHYGIELTAESYCGLGSVKTNIGHLESAAGIAGVIKVLLAMKYKKLPMMSTFHQLNPRINLDGSPFYIVKETKNWECLKTKEGRIIPRRAGVSSFGFGGVNAHVIIEESLVPEEIVVTKIQRPSHLMTLSAKTDKALKELATKYQIYLKSDLKISLVDICYTTNTGRAHFNHRLAIIASDQQELADKLAKIVVGEEVNSVFSGKLSSNNKAPQIAFLFTGQGSQYVNMGRQLYETQPVFRQTLDLCEQILKSNLEKSILDVIYPENTKELNNSVIDQTAYTQPALFAIEYALAQLWKSWGIKPDVVMGHSVGEYVAATVAGVFSLEDGLKLIVHRGRLMQQLPSRGEMVAVMASLENVNQLIAPYTEQVAIAAINGPNSIVISGSAEAIRMIQDSLEPEGIKTKQLKVSHAFHSPLMAPMLAEFETVANQITYNQPRIPLLSNVTGTRADKNITTASYWVNHICQPVKFAQSMETLHQEGYEIFLEIGPKPILLGMGRQCLPEDVGVWLPSLRNEQEDWQQMLHSLGELYVRGIKVDWLGFDRDYSRSKVVLPTYPFQRQRYWIERVQNQQVTTSLSLWESLVPKSPEVCLTREKLLLTLTKEREHLLESYLSEEIARVLGLSNAKVDIHQPLQQMGLDSLMAVALKNRIEVNLDVIIPATSFTQALSLSDLVTQVLEELIAFKTSDNKNQGSATKYSDSSFGTLLPLHTNGSKQAFICIHPGGLDISCYSNIAKYLGEDQPYYVLQPSTFDNNYRNLNRDSSSSTPIKDVAAQCIEVLHDLQLQEPYLLGGWSLGGIVALEMAQQMQKQGKRVELLALLDVGNLPKDDDWTMVAWFASYLGVRGGKQFFPIYHEFLEGELNHLLKHILKQAIKMELVSPHTGLEEIHDLFQIYKNGLNASLQQARNHQLQVYANQIDLFQTSEILDFSVLNNTGIETVLNGEYLSQFSIHPIKRHLVPGNHYTMFIEPYVKTLSEKLTSCLNALPSV